MDRVEDVTKVTVYSNQPEVELFANGVSLGKQTSDVHFFYFEVPNTGITELVAKAGACEDSSRIVKVDKFNDAYRMVETGDVLNWFEITAPEGYFSINDKMSDLMANPAGKKLIMNIMKEAMAGKKGMIDSENMMNNEAMMGFMGGFTIKRLMSMMGTMGGNTLGKKEMLAFNEKLNRIKK